MKAFSSSTPWMAPFFRNSPVFFTAGSRAA
jgi:hypothetical protein